MTDDSDATGSPWQSAAMHCLICAHEWVATFPVEAPRLECPACSYMNQIPVPANPDDDRSGYAY